MSRTNDLKKLIKSQLEKVCENVYHEKADEKKLYPHIVFSIESIDTGDLHRKDYIINIDIWDKSDKTVLIDDLADDVEYLFHAVNLPQGNILPTCFTIDRKRLEDEDKEIKHRLIRLQVQNYTRKE